MRFTKLAVALFTSVAIAADANSVVTLIKAIGTSTNQLGLDVSRYNGGVPGLPYALQVQQDAVFVHKQILLATTEAQNSGPFLEPGSLNIAAALLEVTGTVTNTLRNTASKNKAFGELGPIVLASLYQLKLDTNNLATEIVKRLALVEQLAAPLVVGTLNTEFNNAIVAYGGKGEFLTAPVAMGAQLMLRQLHERRDGGPLLTAQTYRVRYSNPI